MKRRELSEEQKKMRAYAEPSPDAYENEELARALCLAKQVVTCDYLEGLGSYEIEEFPNEIKGSDNADTNKSVSAVSRIYRITKLVCDRDENVHAKLTTVMSSASANGFSLVTIIKGSPEGTEYYIAAVSKTSRSDASAAGNTVKGAFVSNFPGTELEKLKTSDAAKLIEGIFSAKNETKCISSVSSIASVRDSDIKENRGYVQGMEKVIDSVRDRNYTLMIIADPISCGMLSDVRSGYERLYTSLSPFARTEMSINGTDAVTLSSADTKGFSNSVTKSISYTQGESKTLGWENSVASDASKTLNRSTLFSAGAKVALDMGTILTLANPAGLALSALGMAAGAIANTLGFKTRGKAEESSQKEERKDREGMEKKDERTETSSDYRTVKKGESSFRGQSVSISSENREVRSLMEKIDKQIERLDKCGSYGAFSCSAYIIAEDRETCSVLSGSYGALVRGEDSYIHPVYINNWYGAPQTKKISEYLSWFTHPVFKISGGVKVTPASVVSGNELAVHMGLPRKSMQGFTVVEMSPFGRNVLRLGGGEYGPLGKIYLGNINYMGVSEKEGKKVYVDADSLAMHTFITGSTGQGKSNTVYTVLDQLRKKEIPFLAVDPSNGEYKKALGGKSGVSVYGTNPYIAEMLRIDPFAFPEEIHVCEHIERLTEVFSACWPMSSYDRSVLREAAERAYVGAGWNVIKSVNRYGRRIFPTFSDVLAQMNGTFGGEKSFWERGGESELCSRIRSLTVGLNGMIFCSDGLSDEELFRKNVIVDISRTGSSETKALIMGLLVMKLREYLMTIDEKSETLRHVTVLEEAHTLLKRVSAENSWLMGRSIETLADVIAEMRAYGEGFVISDRSPGLLDASVIRNTNTKIIFRLPDQSDRELAGRAAGLDDGQIKELAVLKKGVAAVYQNDWAQTVLCETNAFKNSAPYVLSEKTDERADIAEKLREGIISGNIADAIDGQEEAIVRSDIPTPLKGKLLEYKKAPENVKWETLAEAAYTVFGADGTFMDGISTEADVRENKNTLLGKLGFSAEDISAEAADGIVSAVLFHHIQKTESSEARKLFSELKKADRTPVKKVIVL